MNTAAELGLHAADGFNHTCGSTVKLRHITTEHIHDVGDFIHVTFEVVGTKVKTILKTTYDLVTEAPERSGAIAGRHACLLACERRLLRKSTAVAQMIRGAA